MTDKKTVSTERVWMKHFPEESRTAEFPRMKVYSYLKETNKHRLHHTALYYYGAKIQVKTLIAKIDEVADAFAAFGIKQGDVVSLLSASTPESIMVFYALNKIGATLNAIDPRLDANSITRMITSSGSVSCVVEIWVDSVAPVFSVLPAPAQPNKEKTMENSKKSESNRFIMTS